MREFWRCNKRVIMVAALLLLVPSGARAFTIPDVVITEVQTGSQASASEEFIELINASSSAVDISNWRVEYYPASTTNFDKPLRSILLHGLLPVGEHYLLTSKDYLADKANDSFSAVLAASGGHLRLIQQDNGQSIVKDQLSWGSILTPTAGIPALEPGKSAQRKIENNSPVYTGDMLVDFTQDNPTPQGTKLLQEPPDEPKSTPQATIPTTSEPVNTISTVDIEQLSESSIFPKITEIMPNPAPPLTDADDEFIELYNESTQAFDLTGYKLQTGSTFNHSYTFPDGSVLGAGVYNAYYVSQTNATLANTGGKVRLVSPTGQVISQTESYADADDGQSWAWDGQSWMWSTKPTPGAQNIISVPKITTNTAASAKSTSKKSTSKPKAKTTATKASAKTTKPKASAVVDQAGSSGTPSTKANLHPLVLAGVGGVALLYGAYEYRQDIANAFYKICRYRKSS